MSLPLKGVGYYRPAHTTESGKASVPAVRWLATQLEREACRLAKELASLEFGKKGAITSTYATLKLADIKKFYTQLDASSDKTAKKEIETKYLTILQEAEWSLQQLVKDAESQQFREDVLEVAKKSTGVVRAVANIGCLFAQGIGTVLQPLWKPMKGIASIAAHELIDAQNRTAVMKTACLLAAGWLTHSYVQGPRAPILDTVAHVVFWPTAAYLGYKARKEQRVQAVPAQLVAVVPVDGKDDEKQPEPAASPRVGLRQRKVKRD